jgi:NADPH:quinone reductase-like Zn-dependent oxidoreductase
MPRAVRLSRFGGPEVLEVAEVDEPHASAGRVRVTVRAAGLNPYDSKLRGGAYPQMKLPRGLGSEFAGVIDEVGEDVEGLAVGDEVLGWAPACMAELVVAKATSVAPKPAGLDWAVAGGIGLVGNTARRSSASLSLSERDTVLVSGVAGGVGLLSAQFALRAGAKVIGTASAAHHDFLRGLGIVPVTYGEGLKHRLEAAAPSGITAMLDNVGRESVEIALALGVPAGRINSVAYDGAELGIGTVGGGDKTSAELAELARLAAHGDLVLPILARFALDDVRAAYELLDTGHGLGKIVLTLP